MGLINFLKGVAAQVNPFDNGRTYGSYNPPRKKRPEDQQQQQNPRAPQAIQPGVSDNPGVLTVQRPDNLFADLNQHLAVHNPAPNPMVTVTNTPQNQPVHPPQPGTVVQPTHPVVQQPITAHAIVNSNPNPVHRDPALDMRNRPMAPAGLPSNAEIAAKSVGSVGSNLAGGLLGVAKGIVQLPSAVLSAPKLVRLGAAKVTGNKQAEQNISNDNGILAQAAKKYEDFVKPVTQRLTTAESATDTAARNLSPWAPHYVAPATKVLANLIPVDAAVSGASNLSKARNAERIVREGEATTGAAGSLGSGSKVIDNLLSEAQLQELTRPPVQVPITQVGGNVPIPVNIPRPGPIIREIGGDAPNVTRIPTPEEAAAQRASDQFQAQAQGPGRPDQKIEGVTPRPPERPFVLNPSVAANTQEKLVGDYADILKNMGEGNGVAIASDGRRLTNNMRFGDTGGKRMTKQDWLDEAKSQLDSGKAEPGIQQAYHDAANPDVQALINKGERPPVPEGRPITVKQAKGIDVIDQTEVPQNLPETPGTVRPTVQTSPMAAKTEAVANAPVVTNPQPLPAEVQNVLDNPRQFTKRQVAAARNQRKLAKQLAKTKADTQAVIDNSPALSGQAAADKMQLEYLDKKAEQQILSPEEMAQRQALQASQANKGFAKTGEYKRGVNGNVSEVAHQSTEAAQAASETANLSSGDVLAKAAQDVAQNGVVSPQSVRNIQAMLDSGRFTQTSPEYRALSKTLYGAGSDYGRGLSLFNPTMRRTASGDQLANRFVSKLYGVVEDGSKITDSHIAMVSQADNTFTAARDAANQALDRYNATKSAGDFTAWKQARQAADDAEKHALITEYRVSNEVLKGNKNPEALKAIQQAEKDAGVYQMDWIDSSMLSGTGTFARNAMNTSLIRLENATFGRLPGGGRYSGKGAKLGTEAGNRTIVSDFKARNELDQNKLSKVVKQWSTTGNTLSEGNINAVGSARAYRFYENQLKAQGVKGDQLARDTEVMLHSDPDKMVEHYNQWALSENALSSLSHNNKKIEQQLVDAIASKIGSKTAAKAAVRLTVGFPTVIGRSLIGGAKRATLGLPELGMAGRALAKGDKQAAADLLYNAKIHGGSGAALYGLGTVLASAGLVSPSYPTDPAEQARWKSEGIQPNSIKIGGNWFGIPGFFGALALPLVIPANIQGKSSPADVAKGIVSGLQDLSPASGIINFVDGIEGRSGKQWVKNEVASLTRAATPVGSLLNEIAKMTDDTKNDTTTKDGIHNLLDAIAGGIPGVNNKVNTIPATDANGNVLHNPNPAATFFGAQGSEQPQGKQDVKEAQGAANDTYKQLNDYGVLKDKTLMGLVDKKIQAQIGRGEKLTPEDVAKVQKAITKGVSESGEDTAYLEKGQYDTNLAVLKVKRDLASADPTTKPSSLKDLDTAIKRGGVYKDHKVPYEMIDAYKSTSESEWHKMGIPPGDKNYDPDVYDPEMYQKLWEMDQMMTKAGVSYRKGHLDKNKYSDVSGKEKAKREGSGVRQLDTSFGTLKDSKFAPQLQQYDTIDSKSGSIPHISVVRPNIVHKITSSG